MALHDFGYKRWTGVHHGIWRRRFAITHNGLRLAFQNRWTRNLVVVCWSMALVEVWFLFVLGQLLVPTSFITDWLGQMNPGIQALSRGIVTWMDTHPSLSIGTTENLLFYYFSYYLLPFSFLGIGLVIPFLITRDLSSSAILVYSSKAISRWDYIVGKFGVVFGMLMATWLGPLVAAWTAGNLLAPDWRFLWYSQRAFGHMFLFVFLAMIVLSVAALGVSALSSKEKGTTTLWVMWWILGYLFVHIIDDTKSKPWLRHLSLSFDLQQLGLKIFGVGSDLNSAVDQLPMFGDMMRNVKPETMDAISNPRFGGSAVFMILLLGCSALLLRKRVKPE